MFFRRRKDQGDDSELDKLDELVGSESPVEQGIRKALKRADLSAEDRRELEDALKRLRELKPPPSDE